MGIQGGLISDCWSDALHARQKKKLKATSEKLLVLIQVYRYHFFIGFWCFTFFEIGKVKLTSNNYLRRINKHRLFKTQFF